MTRGFGLSAALAPAVTLILALIPVAAPAQTIVYQDYIFKSDICVGLACPDTSYTGSDNIRIMDSANAILVDDSSAPGTFPDNDWRLVFNDDFEFGANFFAVEDHSTGLKPFVIDAGAPANLLRLAAPGQIGIGTAMPQQRLHLVSGADTALRLEQDTSQANLARAWDIAVGDTGLTFADTGGVTVPVGFASGAPDDSFVLTGAGAIGLGTASPAAPLHLLRHDGTAALMIDEADPVATARTLMTLRNNGRPEIVMGNTDTGKEWAFGAGTNFFLKRGPLGSASFQKTLVLTVKQNGDAVLLGSLTTGGTTCGTGCDRVFADDYALPSIEDHAEEMFLRGHLPNIGPTVEGAPLNLTEKLGGVINELEHAHIYIARQEARIAELERLVRDLTRAINR